MRNLNKIAVLALALGGALGAGVAQARGHDDVQWSITIGAPFGGVPVYSQPAPVYSPGYPVYSQPSPVYGPGYPVYSERVPVYRDPRYSHPTRWDHDGDGIPNRYDRVYNPRWDRDGDGVPDRYERHQRIRYDRDRDGIPDWRDRHDDRSGRGWGR